MAEARPLGDEAEPAPRRGLRLLVLLPALGFVGLAILFAYRLGAGDPSRLPSALIGRAAPAIALPALDGLRDAAGGSVPGFATHDLATGGVAIVNVWASWCAPCQVEHPLLMTLAREAGLRLVGFNYKDRPEAALRFLSALGNPFRAVGVDPSGRAAIDWGVYGVPETFVLGPDGRIRYKHVGPLTPETLPGFMDEVRAAARP